MGRANPYGDVDAVEEALREYWAKKNAAKRDTESRSIPRYRRFQF